MHTQIPNTKMMLSLFASCPDILESAIAGLGDTDLDHSLTPESWTIRQIVHHIADGDDLWKSFIKQAAGAPGTHFALEWYWQIQQDQWVEHWAYGKRAVEPSLALFRASRANISQLLTTVPEVWGNSLVIRLPGRPEECVTIREVIEMQTRHVSAHIEEIKKIRGCSER